jgi:hypothetical protein
MGICAVYIGGVWQMGMGKKEIRVKRNYSYPHIDLLQL